MEAFSYFWDRKKIVIDANILYIERIINVLKENLEPLAMHLTLLCLTSILNAHKNLNSKNLSLKYDKLSVILYLILMTKEWLRLSI